MCYPRLFHLNRAFRADLHVAKLNVEIWIRDGQIVGGASLPTALWVSHGHRAIAALLSPAGDLLIDAFGHFCSVNGKIDTQCGRASQGF
jgi:hypothetical protein